MQMSEHRSAAGVVLDGQGLGNWAISSQPIKSSHVKASSFFTMKSGKFKSLTNIQSGKCGGARSERPIDWRGKYFAKEGRILF